MSPLQSFVSFLSISQNDLQDHDIEQAYNNDNNSQNPKAAPGHIDHASFFTASMGIESISHHDYDCAIDEDEFEEDLFTPLHRCGAEQSHHYPSVVTNTENASSSVEVDPFEKLSTSMASSASSVMYSSGSDSGHELSKSGSRRSARQSLKRFATSLSFLSRRSYSSKSSARHGEYDGTVVATTVSAPAELPAPPSRSPPISITSKRLASWQSRHGRDADGKRQSMPDLAPREHLFSAWGSYGTIPL